MTGSDWACSDLLLLTSPHPSPQPEAGGEGEGTINGYRRNRRALGLFRLMLATAWIVSGPGLLRASPFLSWRFHGATTLPCPPSYLASDLYTLPCPPSHPASDLYTLPCPPSLPASDLYFSPSTRPASRARPCSDCCLPFHEASVHPRSGVLGLIFYHS